MGAVSSSRGVSCQGPLRTSAFGGGSLDHMIVTRGALSIRGSFIYSVRHPLTIYFTTIISIDTCSDISKCPRVSIHHGDQHSPAGAHVRSVPLSTFLSINALL